ncbi:MAG: GTP-binding protein, partial [Myxococcota bacterium]
MSVDPSRIRNFCIIAHIDHGKSTLSDRLLEFTHALSDRDKKDQFLDNMDIERERGITIKAQTARMSFTAADGETYILNLIDTPGHVDFSYEVSRALSACEGALLVVDAAQGIEAQTLANAYLAVDADLELLPIVNKIDLPSADPDRVAQEIEDIVGLDAADVLQVSAKTGVGVGEILQAIVDRIPPPTGAVSEPARALIFDAWFDPYVGVVMVVRVVNGILKRRDRIKFIIAGVEQEIARLDVIDPVPRSVETLSAGEVGLVIAGIKSLGDVQIGDTITTASKGATEALPGFHEVKAMVFTGLY